jgi:hypothetical protein
MGGIFGKSLGARPVITKWKRVPYITMSLLVTNSRRDDSKDNLKADRWHVCVQTTLLDDTMVNCTSTALARKEADAMAEYYHHSGFTGIEAAWVHPPTHGGKPSLRFPCLESKFFTATMTGNTNNGNGVLLRKNA